MIEKKTRYAVLVKEMFLPTIDRLKKQELLSLQSEKQLRKISPKSPKLDENRLIGSDSEGKKKVYKKKKFKENPLVPKPPVKKDPKVVDFLGERRRIRDEVGENNQDVDFDWKKELDKDLPEHQIAKNLKKKAKILEKEARKQELLMGTPGSINAKSLKQSENVNDLLLNSIKAKLAVLDHKNN